MFHTKICGITSIKDAQAVAAAGAGAIGLNFYAKSPRSIDAGLAHEIVAALPPELLRVGVFVNLSVDEITDLVERVPLDVIQLHGDEPPELLADLPEAKRILRAHRMTTDGLAVLQHYIEVSLGRGRQPDGVLIDAAAPGAYGGTGEQADWELLAQERHRVAGMPLILAGGLRASNVAAAIAAVRPDGVDTASGVETSPGVKSAEQVGEFVQVARAALSACDQESE